MRPSKAVYELLLIEDSLPDVGLVKYLLAASTSTINIQCAYDGAQASDFLFRRGEYAGRPDPDLILLDLNLPMKDGRELLREIKPDPVLGKIPVVMLSTSNSQAEIAEIYGLGANAFISKPTDLEEFQTVLNSLVDFWFKRVALPYR